ncbi:MAG TPA: hypothetical protein PLU17_02670 [Chitinophagaceae bacterium]|jgi:hypothetical protein|nr:hypothetical protein [Chitinophagaceae bacterium]
MKSGNIILLLIFILSIIGCTKGPGTGGRASIKGRIFAKNYDKDYFLIDSGYFGGVKVYINYGDQVGVGDDVDSDQDGNFLFPYLRPGNYTVYVYSKKLSNNTLDSAVVKKVTISERKEEVDLSRIDINTFKN